MVRTILTFLMVAVSSSPSIGDECHYESDGESLYFVTPLTALVERRPGLLPYACSLLSAGTGSDERGADCSDGVTGAIAWIDDNTVRFRDREWTEVCR